MIVLFADDTCMTIQDHDIENLQITANIEISKLNNWFQANCLSLNVDKTKYVIFLEKKVKTHNQITNNIKVEQVKMIKYLGMIIDDKLKFNEHIENRKNKTSIILKIRHKLNTDSKLTLYNAFIYPHLTYAAQINGNTHDIYLKKLQTMQNKMVNILFNHYRILKTKLIYEKYKILKLKEIIEL